MSLWGRRLLDRPSFLVVQICAEVHCSLGSLGEQVHFLNLCRDSPLPQRPLHSPQEYVQRVLAPVAFVELHSHPVVLQPCFLPLPSTLRSPSFPIHEEDEEKLSEDSDAPLPPSGVELVLRESSSPEVRPWPPHPGLPP